MAPPTSPLPRGGVSFVGTGEADRAQWPRPRPFPLGEGQGEGVTPRRRCFS